MSDNRILSEVMATLGAVFWSIQLIPQVVLNYRRHNTEGLQPSMMLLWASAGIPLGVYNILSSKGIALQVQPQILTALSLATFAQCCYYGWKWSATKSTVVVAGLGFLAGGIELALILPFTTADKTPPHWFMVLMAVLSAVGLGLGVLRHYWDIYVHRNVRGISFWFVFLDAAGDLTSLISVAVIAPFDVLGAVIYAVELVLWMGIMLAGVAYNLRSWIQDQREGVDDASANSDQASSVFSTARPADSLAARMRLRTLRREV